MSKLFSKITLVLLVVLGFISCVKHEFDEPPVGGSDPNVTANATIAQIKALHSTGQFEKITDDLILSTIVTADDKSGNYYKTFIVQDATGGIEVKINASNQYVNYPIGRRVFIKCKGLVLGDYNGVTQLGGNTYVDVNQATKLGGIEQTLASQFLLPGQYNQVVTPKKVKIQDLQVSDISTLISIDDVEFAQADAAKMYADPTGGLSVNHNIEDCNNNTIVMRTSNYASFASDLTPSGKGTLTAIYSVFGTTKQVFIRDTRDVVMIGDRCNGGSTGSVTPNTTIAQLKALLTSSFNVINGDAIIEGVVTADDQSGNFYKEIEIQDATGGLGIKINLTKVYQNYPVGTKVGIKCKGLTLGDDSGVTKLGGSIYVSGTNTLLGGLDATQLSAAFVKTGNGTPVAKAVTITSLNDNDLSNLIKLSDVQFVSGDVGQPYADAVGLKTVNRIVEDCTGNTITVRTSGYADFAASNTPAGKGTLTGIYETFGTTKQLYIRSTPDANMNDTRCSGGGGNPGLDAIDMSFEGIGLVDKKDLNLAGWYNIAEVGTRLWQSRIFTATPNTYAQATAFGSKDASNTYWLITPGLDLSVAHTLSFESAMAYWVHDGLTVWISTDFTGSNVATATWTKLNCTLAGQSEANYTFVPSGTIDLPVVATSKAYIGFKYTGDGAVNTTTYQVDNIVVKKK